MEKVEDHMGLVNWIASSYHQIYKNRYEYEDLVQTGYIGLCKAVESFNPELGFKFATYAVPTIRGELYRLIRDDRYYPAHQKQRHSLQLNFLSLNEIVCGEGEVEYIDAIESEENLESIYERMDLERALNQLPEIERTIIECYFFKELKQSEIGEILQISQVHVSRILKRTLKKLRQCLS